jgi:hypothetical protein
LAIVTFEGATPPAFGATLGVFNNTSTTLRIFVPAGSAAAYRAVLRLDTWRNRIHSVGCDLPNEVGGVNCSCE